MASVVFGDDRQNNEGRGTVERSNGGGVEEGGVDEMAAAEGSSVMEEGGVEEVADAEGGSVLEEGGGTVGDTAGRSDVGAIGAISDWGDAGCTGFDGDISLVVKDAIESDSQSVIESCVGPRLIVDIFSGGVTPDGPELACWLVRLRALVVIVIGVFFDPGIVIDCQNMHESVMTNHSMCAVGVVGSSECGALYISVCESVYMHYSL